MDIAVFLLHDQISLSRLVLLTTVVCSPEWSPQNAHLAFEERVLRLQIFLKDWLEPSLELRLGRDRRAVNELPTPKLPCSRSSDKHKYL